MKAPADILEPRVIRKIAQQRGKKRACADLPARAVRKKIEWIGTFVGRFVAGHFQFDGRLRFVVDRGAYAREGGNGIKQASTTRRTRRMDVAIDHLQDNL